MCNTSFRHKRALLRALACTHCYDDRWRMMECGDRSSWFSVLRRLHIKKSRFPACHLGFIEKVHMCPSASLSVARDCRTKLGVGAGQYSSVPKSRYSTCSFSNRSLSTS